MATPTAHDRPSRPRRSAARVTAAPARARRLREEPFWTALFEAHPQPVLLADAATLRLVGANRAACARYGYDEAGLTALSVADLHPRGDVPAMLAAWALRGRAGRAPFAGTHVAKDGATFAVEVRVTAAFVWRGRRIRMIVVTDVTDRNNALAQSRASDARYRQIVDTAVEGVVIIDPDRVLSVVNQQASDMLGYAVDEAVQPDVTEFATDAALPGDDSGPTGERETTLRRKDGSTVTVLLSESPLLDSGGAYAGQLGMITDLSERDEFAAELAFQSTHDPLTGLPNRLALVDRLERTLRRATHGNQSVAVALLDIDGFTDINTAHGVACGDELLKGIAARLATSVGAGDVVARFGGDEFAVVATGTGSFAAALADRLRAALAAPYTAGDAQVTITTGMGVALWRHGDRASALLRGADLALLRAKAGGRGGTEFVTEALRARSRQRLAVESDLRRAVERHELTLLFQPVVSLADASIVGAEALVRWEHPRRGTLMPHEFITAAEETGLIDPIGRWVIEEACRRFARWQRRSPDLTMAVNVSAQQLAAGTLEGIVRNAVALSSVDPAHLALEITEGILMDDVDLSVAILTALRKTGVTISVDDFGTGYSSLSYLNRFPVDVLKIDQTFVSGLPGDAYDTALVEAVIGIAGALDLDVIAEGVENAAQAETLLRLGCNRAQGFHFARPLTAEAFTVALAATPAPVG
jgi:diguanylate cyclase (GGDEF)-like protein/PAS domain S-box-containing protein